jgi:predicted PolB exonuclease-like 3'-5' exonuclease
VGLDQPGLVKVMPNKYAKDTKKFTFYAKDTLHADFKVRMQYHSMTQSEFLRACVQAVVEKDAIMESFLDDYKEKNNKQSKKQREQIKKDIEKSEELLNDFGLGDGDIDSIFDIIAKEHPEI